MCTKSQVISPSGSLFNKNSKYVDPLGVTKTAVGDPTGGIRKERKSLADQAAAERKASEDAKNVVPNALANAKRLADESTASTLNQRLKRRSAFAVSLLGSAAGG